MKPKRRKQGKREAERFRSRYAWRRKRQEIQARDHHLCRYCLERGVFTCGGLAVHHIVPLEERPELGLDDGNLITLCERCHEAAERGTVGREILRRLAGTPLPLTGF